MTGQSVPFPMARSLVEARTPSMAAMVEDIQRQASQPLREKVEPTARIPGVTLEPSFMKDYAEAAALIGYKPKGLECLRFEAFCNENGIPNYDRAEVKAYLDKEYGGADQPNRRSYEERRIGTWGWRELVSSGARVTYPYTSDMFLVSFAYNKAIPHPVVLRAGLIKKEFPDAIFYVSDGVNERDMIRPVLDPFLMVQIEDKYYIVDKWDEPGFKPSV